MLPCTPLVSSASPHLPLAGLHVSLAGVAQSCLTDRACDKEADWGGRKDGLQRHGGFST